LVEAFQADSFARADRLQSQGRRRIRGFAALFAAPTLAVVVILQVVQRWMNFALTNAARQVFFTVLGREEKYNAKNLIDVVIYRGSDALYGWVFDSLQALGLKLGAIALCMVPIAASWLILSTTLGRSQERQARDVEEIDAITAVRENEHDDPHDATRLIAWAGPKAAGCPRATTPEQAFRPPTCRIRATSRC
jgi:hypothetical protein